MGDLSRRIDDALAGWGTHPVLVEVNGAGESVSVDAPVFRTIVTGIARECTRNGVGPDTKVALFLENSVTTVATIVALIGIGAIPVFAKLEYRRRELTVIFDDIDPDAVIAEEGYLPVLAPFLRGTDEAGGYGVTRREIGNDRYGTGDRYGQRPRGIATQHAGAGGVSWITPVPGSRRDTRLSDEVVSINCTYRGDGTLLGSMATEKQYLLGAQVLQDGLQAQRGDTMLYPIPMSHIFTLVGCIFVPLFYGITGVIARTVHPRVLFEAIAGYDVNHITAVPEIYRLLLRSKGADRSFPSLRSFVSGGSVLEAEEWESLGREFAVEVLHGYGLTEFTPVSRNIRGASRGGTVGPVCDGLCVEIADPDGEGRGEIRIRGDALGRGYLGNPGATAAAFHDGWFYTGDRGHFEEEHLVFDTELKGTRKINGVIVDLEEVRRAFLAASIAADAEVFVDGNSVVALVEMPESADIEKEEKRIRQILRYQLAPYKIPRRIARRR
ncbi:MAG: class I adenylate-forming enzyme family protein [Alkalispirochaeta sp.]